MKTLIFNDGEYYGKIEYSHSKFYHTTVLFYGKWYDYQDLKGELRRVVKRAIMNYCSENGMVMG